VAEDYTYIVARVRAIEAAMPDVAWFQRLARTSQTGLIATLREYYHGFETVDSLFEFEKGIEAEKVAVLNLISNLIADPGTRIFLRGGDDCDNVLHTWKAQKLGARPTLNPFGLVEGEVVEKAIASGDWEPLPEYCRDLLGELETWGGMEAPPEAEYRGEAAKWRFLMSAAPDARAREFVRMKIDLMNIKTFVRLKRTSLRREALDLVWIACGGIESAKLAALFKEPEDELYAFLEMTDYRGLVRLGLGKDIPLWRIDPLMRRHLLSILGESRYRFFDISPVLYHLELWERDMQLLRSIIVGKLNRLPEEMIMERADTLLPS